MAASTADLRTLYTINTGPGNSVPQPAPADSLGGWTSQTSWPGATLHDLFDALAASVLAAGTPDYRCVYVCNAHATDPMTDLRVYLLSEIAGGSDFAFGLDPTPLSLRGAVTQQTVRTATIYTAPAGVVFVSPTSNASGLALGDIPAGSGRGLWIRRTPDPSVAAPATDEASLAFEFGS